MKLLEQQLHEATSKQADLVKEKEELQGELALVSVLYSDCLILLMHREVITLR